MTIRNRTTGVTYATISAALAALPSPLTADVILEDIDGATYSESVQLTTARAYMVTLRAGTHLRPTISSGAANAINQTRGNYTVEGFYLTSTADTLRLDPNTLDTNPRVFRSCIIDATGAASSNPVVVITRHPGPGHPEFFSCLFERRAPGQGALISIGSGGDVDFTGCTFIQPQTEGSTIAGAAISYAGSQAGDELRLRASILRYRGQSHVTNVNAILRFNAAADRDRYVGDGNVFSRYLGVGSNANHVAYVVTGGLTYTTLASWSATTGEDVESIEDDAAAPHAALFVDESTRDYRITTTSVAYGSVMAGQEGLSTVDVDGRGRPQGTASDRGAYEATVPRDWDADYETQAAQTWSANLASRQRGWAVLARIEGIGDAAGQWTLCSNVPAYGDATYRPWLVRLPDILSERVDLGGGVPEAGSCSLEVVDVRDQLTGLLRTEAPAYTALDEDVDSTETVIELGRTTDLSGVVVWMGSEAMLVTGVGTSPTSITVTRGYLGTEATTHQIGDPVFIFPNYLEGRRFSVYLVPLYASSSAEERLVGTYLLERVSWDEALNAWTMAGSSQQRYLDRQAPIAPRTATTIGDVAPGIVLMDTTPTTINAPWPDALAHLAVGSEIVQVYDETRHYFPSAVPQPRSSRWELRLRGLLGTEEEPISRRTKVTQTWLAGRDLRYSPGPTPSTSRASGTWTPATHWIDLLLILLLSSADEADGLELTNYGTTGSNWARSNFASLPPGYGAGIPHALIDWSSWESVRNRTLSWTLPFFAYGHERPSSFADYIGRQFLRPVGAYLSVDGGTIRLGLARIPLPDEAPAVDLDETSLLRRATEPSAYLPRLSVQRDRTSAYGAVVYRVGPQEIAAIYRNADYGRTYGQRGWYGAIEPALTIDVPGGDPDVAELYGSRASALLYRQHRPPVELDCEADARLFPSATVGALVGVTLPEVPDLAAGTRGWTHVLTEVAERELRAETSRSMDGSDALGVTMRLRLRRYGATTRLGRIGPAAHVVSVASSVATVAANRYTQPDATDGLPTSDAAAFAVDDEVILVDLDGAVVSGTPETVTSVGANALTLTGDFSGALAADLVLVSANVDDASAAQRAAYVYHADQDTQTVGTTADTLWRWSEP